MSRATNKLVTLINIARLRKARKLETQHHYMSQFAAVEATEYEEPEREQHTKTLIDEEGGQHSNNDEKSSMMMMQGIQMKQNWIPHPKSGIYFPEGYDWVMNDVSENSASLGQSHSFWLRNGAEKHDPDLQSADDYFLTSASDHTA